MILNFIIILILKIWIQDSICSKQCLHSVNCCTVCRGGGGGIKVWNFYFSLCASTGCSKKSKINLEHQKRAMKPNIFWKNKITLKNSIFSKCYENKRIQYCMVWPHIVLVFYTFYNNLRLFLSNTKTGDQITSATVSILIIIFFLSGKNLMWNFPKVWHKTALGYTRNNLWHKNECHA